MGRKGCKSVGPVNTQMNPGILVRWDASGKNYVPPFAAGRADQTGAASLAFVCSKVPNECGIISNRNEVECIILSSVLISTPFIPSGLGRKEIDCPYIYMSPSL